MMHSHLPTDPAGSPESPDPFLTIDEVLVRYRLKRDALMRLVDAGEFPAALRVTRKLLLFRASDVAAWEDGRWLLPGDQAARRDQVRLLNSIRQPRALRQRRRAQ